MGSKAPEINEKKFKKIVKLFVSKLSVVKRPTINNTLRINSDLQSVEDFYVEQLLRYKSIIRLSRNKKDSQDMREERVTQRLVFSADEDLVSEKEQRIYPENSKNIPHRGTITEEHRDLGTYKKILDLLDSIGLEHASLALIIRKIFCQGAEKTFEELRLGDKDGGSKLSDWLSQHKKRIIVTTVELLFGTEGFRSPASIVETNMVLDLIIAKAKYEGSKSKIWSFKQAFQGIQVKGKKRDTEVNNGGALSFTMKTLSKAKTEVEHSGGIVCGRSLSKEFDDILKTTPYKYHKYGGPLKVEEDDLTEYKRRKTKIAESWMKKFFPGKPLSELAFAIQKSYRKWYSNEDCHKLEKETSEKRDITHSFNNYYTGRSSSSSNSSRGFFSGFSMGSLENSNSKKSSGSQNK